VLKKSAKIVFLVFITLMIIGSISAAEVRYGNGKLIEGKLRGVGMSIGLELYYDHINKQYSAEMSFSGGEPCVYMEIPGAAKITAIKPARAELNNCPRHPVEVLFDFTPADPKRSAKCLRDQHMTVGDGKNPSLDFVENRGLKVGQTLSCICKKIVTGACSPIVFIFPDINLGDYAKWCF
jgi:hypothetical protein